MKLSTGLRAGILSAALVFGLMLAGCNIGGDDDDDTSSVNKSALTARIAQAEAAKAGVLIAASKDAVAQGMKYTGQTAMNTFDAAITAAKAVNANGSATKEQVASALQTLNEAISAFNASIKTDGEKSTGFTAEELTALITSVEAAKAGVAVSANGADKPSSVYWVTQDAMDALDAAITAAKAAATADQDALYTALVNAINVFNAAKRAGTAGAPSSSVDKSALEAKIMQAEAAKTGVLIAASSTDAAQGMKYTDQTAMNTFNIAIMAARAVCDNASASKESVTSAAQTLDAAITAFNDSIKTDGSKHSNFSAAELTALIVSAKSAKAGVIVSVNGTEQPSNVYWVTQTALDTFNAAITAAEAAATANRDAQYIALAAALNAFNAAKQPGTKTKTLTITGLSSPDGAFIQIVLYATENEAKALQMEAYTPVGLGTIQGGSAVTTLRNGENDSPWSGDGSWYVVMLTEDAGRITTYVTKSAKSFAGDSVTVPFSDFRQLEVAVDAKGYITGSVTLTNIPAPKPQVQIIAYADGQSTGSRPVDGIGVTYYDVQENGSFSIPFGERFRSALDAEESLTLHFELIVGSGANQYTIEVPQTPAVTISDVSGNGTLNAGNLGSVSLKSAVLSGTVTAHDGGERIPRVGIRASNAAGESLGDVLLYSPQNGASWSLTIPAQQGGAVYLEVRVYGPDYNYLFGKEFSPESTATASVTDQSITGIALNVGDFFEGGMSGTMSFTNMPNPPPHRIEIRASYNTGASSYTNINSGTVTLDGNAGTWKIPRNDGFLAALEDGGVTVRFELMVRGHFSGLPGIEKTISKNSLTGIDLGTIDFAQAQ
ncbi:MAG: FIVAR domain-containing protein [Treponema sp.]|jgi:hypothetical protein|nr:FIVAR domain-containing protein [Treponema sp.]